MGIIRFFVFILVWVLTMPVQVKGQIITRIDPPNWWLDHPIDTVEILVSGQALQYCATLPSTQGIVSASTFYGEGDYIHIKFWINPTFQGRQLDFKLGEANFSFPLLKRSGYSPLGLSPSDLVYLITPDRFHNGEQNNDDIEGMNERGVDLNDPYARHGGDLVGIENRIPYIQALGVSAIWLNPVLENDMTADSYHGYAITDHYNIDLRHGGNAALSDLVVSLKEQSIKHVADMVYNHWGSEHYLNLNLPDSAMIHWTEEGEAGFSNFRFTTMTDPHRRTQDSLDFQDGWFAGAMPDLNQDHPLTSAYLTYSTLWYIEMFQVDALRCDTYAFASQDFLLKHNSLLKKAYPDLFVFGETWAYSETSQAFFAPNHLDHVTQTGADAVTDFTLWRAIHEMYSSDESEQYSWGKGAGSLYYRLASDLLYNNPNDLVIFLDNHDDGRFLGQMQGDLSKLKSGLVLLYAMRGIPVLYYGTELGLLGHENHGAIREDMPGFANNTPDYSIYESVLLSLCEELGKQRKTLNAQLNGPLIQHLPENGWYIFERPHATGTLVVVCNAASEERAHSKYSTMKSVVQSGSNNELFAPWETRWYMRYESNHRKH